MTNTTPTSERILDAARALIMAGGYNGFSYADIANAVGIRKASIHHHFPGKADLVERLVDRYRQDATAAIAEVERQVPAALDQLRHYTGYWEKCIADGSRPFCICALLACEVGTLPQGVSDQVRGYFGMLRDWLTRAMDRGARDGSMVISAPPAVEAEVFMAAVHGAMLSARAMGDPQIFATVARSLILKLSAPV